MKNSSGNLDSIVANDNFKNNSIIEVRNGEYLELSDCCAVQITNKVGVDITSEGMFRVGIDIEPGEYKLKTIDDDSGYYCIYNSLRHNIDSIVSNKNFTKSAYVTVSNGQYLLLSDCKISK